MARDTRLNAFLPEEMEAAKAAPSVVPEEPRALPVSALVAAVNTRLDEPRFTDVWVRGEISGFKAHSSGHWYFDLKDEGAVLNAAMFRADNQFLKFRPEDGMDVLVRGRVSIYSARSTLQIVARDIRAVGAGAYQVAFEQLKRRLAAEGLFDHGRKKDLPAHPRRIGIVTSLGAAALRDLVHVATERNPGIQLLVAAARVQGEGSAFEIANAIKRLNATDCDVVIVGRGGGSMEDLWTFNEEIVVRAIAGSRIPVVSAVGHETDVTLADLAADLRAATPSNAAEICVESAEEILASLDDADARMASVLERLVPDLRQRVDGLAERAQEGMRRTVAREKDLLAVNAARLDALSPLATLARGFSVVKGSDGKVVRSVKKAPVGSDITIHLSDGKLDAKVTDLKEEPR